MPANAARVGKQTGVLPSMDAETKTVLVVDDNPITARWVESLVRRMGYEVIVAYDGEDAIHQLAEQPVGTVITDVEMPVINGFDLLQFIRLRWPELPVILMSATSNAERREAARRLGAIAFLEKPVNLDQLAALICAGSHRNEPIAGLHLFSVT